MSAPFATATAEEIARALLARRPAYAPDLRPRDDGPSNALIAIAAEYLESLGERIGRMPDKHLAALLDMLGVSVLPAQPAGATVVFTALPSAPATRVVAGTRLGASIPGAAAPLPFETGADVAVTSSALAEVWTVLPGADAAAEHGADLAAGRGATLFAGAQRVERQLAIGDPVRLALSGRAEILLDLRLRTPGSTALALDWSWWDGEDWQPFAPFADPEAAGDDDSWDGTGGLTRSGRIRLVAPCAKAKRLTIEGVESYWIRARTTVPLSPRPDLRPPEVAAVRIRTVLSRAPVRMTLLPASESGKLTVRVFTADAKPAPKETTFWVRTLSGAGGDVLYSCDPVRPRGPSQDTPAPGTTIALSLDGAAKPDPESFLPPITLRGDLDVDLAHVRGLPPDKAIGDSKPVDVTRAFQPLGQAPTRGAAFYLACDEVFAKPGARVTLSLARPVTASEEADIAGGNYEGSLQSARTFLDNLINTLDAVGANLRALTAAGHDLDPASVPPIDKGSETTAAWYLRVRQSVTDALRALTDAATRHQPAAFNAIVDARRLLAPSPDVGRALAALDSHELDAATILADLASAVALLTSTPTPLSAQGASLRAAAAANSPDVPALQAALVLTFTALPALEPFLGGALPENLVESPEAFRDMVIGRLNSAKAVLATAAATILDWTNQLTYLTPQQLVAGVSVNPTPQLSAAEVVWEYWNGSRWTELAITGDPAGAVASFRASGVIRFDVPEGWEPNEVVNDTRRWLRARLAAGSYTYLRLVAWTDPKTNVLNFLPVVEPRPPVLDGLELFFHYESPGAPPATALTLNDFAWEDVTPGLAQPGPGFIPFRSMPERVPMLYLGFDGPLPADRLGLYVELREPDPDARPLALDWEGYDGVDWRTLSTDDGTRGLTAHGVVGLIWPGDASPPGAALLGAVGRALTLAERDAATRFAPGDRVLVRDPAGGEPGVVAAAAGQTLTLRDPVSRAYVGGEVVDAPPARFGTPRTWLRARFDATAAAPAVELTALAMNATDVAQTESIAGEVPGSSDGSPQQVVFVRRPPILEGEVIEVRELEGARAAVDLPILERELAGDGMAGAARRVVDPVSGAVSEVWVRWAMRSSLGLSGPADRHYTVDRSAGRILFGDGVHGRIPPAASDNIQAAYRTGGGASANVGAGAVSALISPVPASRAGNPLAASGGADAETLAAALARGPALLRHRRMGITTADTADVAHETCPAVARTRVLGARDQYGRPLPGHTRVIVIPDAPDPRPQPDAELRRRVRDALAARAPATAAAGIAVVGPDYVAVGAEVTVRAAVRAEPGPVRAAVLAELERFLHPLRGGPTGTGFDFGRSVFLSDLARTLEALDGVDVVTGVALTRDGVEQGERVDVGPGQLVCAGVLSVTLAGAGA